MVLIISGYPERDGLLVPEVEGLVAEVGWRGRGRVLEVIVARAVVQAGLAVAVAVIVAATHPLACPQVNHYVLNIEHLETVTVFVLLAVLVKRLPVLVYLAPPLHLLHLRSLVLEPNLDNAN